MSSSTALLIMDLQVGNIAQLKTPETYLPLVAKTIITARTRSIPIIYVTVSFRPGHPEVSPRNIVFSRGARANMFVAGAADTAIHPSIAPIAGDIVVEKKRVSAFVGSGLDVILRSLGTTKLVLAGVATGGVVLSTVCDAFDRDFEIVVLEDLCLDRKEATHKLLVEEIFAKRGEVLSAEKWLEGLESK